MKGQLAAIQAEILKNKYSNILWVTFIAFSLAPLMGGVFLMIMQSPQALANAGALNAKIKMMNMSADWSSYFVILEQAIGVGGVLIFGFVASWIFGREYSDGTAKDLLALPTSRTKIINAKFIIYLIWCFALAISNLLIGIIICLVLRIPAGELFTVSFHMKTYFTTTLLTILLGPPIAFFAIWGKGYLAPLGFVALTLVFAQVIAATGYGYYFPWSIPGLYSVGIGDLRDQLDFFSYAILGVTAIGGYFATTLYWKYSDQVK